MKDTKGPVLQAFYDLLSGMTYDGSQVPVNSDKVGKGKEANLYILLINQDETPDNTKSDFTSTHFITVDIVHKTGLGVSRKGVNNVAGQVLAKVMPTKTTTGLIPPEDWQFQNINKEGDRDIDATINTTSHVIRRLITFKITIVQN